MHIARDTAMLGSSGYERVEQDFYETPQWCTETLLRWVKFSRVWEPAAGNGAIASVIKETGCEVICSDIVQRQIPLIEVAPFDYFTVSHPWDIVTNPPYSQAEDFIRHALALTAPHKGRVAMLLRNEFDCASSRQDLFEGPPFALKIVLTTRPRWIAGSKGSPRHNYAWFVWDWQHRGPAQLAYDKGVRDA